MGGTTAYVVGGPKRVKEEGARESNCSPLLPGSVFCSVLPHLLPCPFTRVLCLACGHLYSPTTNSDHTMTRSPSMTLEFPQCMKTIRYQEPGQKQLKILTALKKRKVWQRPRGSRQLPGIDPSSRQLGACGRAVLWSPVLAEFSRDDYPPLF